MPVLAAALVAVLPSSAGAQGAGGDWLTPAGTSQGTRFSTLSEINRGNVASLVEEFAVPTGSKASHEGTPLVVGGTMYVVTPFPHRLIALDLANAGKVLWTYTPPNNPQAYGKACCDRVNRGAAYAQGLVVFATLDTSVVAVDAVTGKEAWRTTIGNPLTGESFTGAPLIVGNKVIVGNAGGEFGVRGRVVGLDLATGGIVWQAYNTGSDADVLIGPGFHPYYAKDQGTNLGATTWPGTLWKEGGATSWGWLTYDPETNLLFHGTANPGVWNPDMRPGDNKWGATIFARDPDTGQAAWAYQLTPHDGWDYDAINESVAVDLAFPGSSGKLLVHFNKNGFAYTLDRTTGRVLAANTIGVVTWASAVDLATGLPQVDPTKLPHQGVITSNICPSPLGMKDWEPSAFSPTTALFYVPAINFCQNLEPLKALFIAGAPFFGNNSSFVPSASNFGELVAWDPVASRKAWGVKEALPLYGGVLATAGNVVFYGTLDRWLRAVDATSGAVLFQTQVECGIDSSPIAYTAPDGHERIAFFSGLGWLAGGFAGGKCLTGTAGVPGGVLHVLKLP